MGEKARDALCLSSPNLANTVAEVGKKLLDEVKVYLKKKKKVGRRFRCERRQRWGERLGLGAAFSAAPLRN